MRFRAAGSSSGVVNAVSSFDSHTLYLDKCELVRRNQHFSPEDGGSMFLENVGIYLQVHMALLPRRPTLTSSQL
jgi:hypothetical protein